MVGKNGVTVADIANGPRERIQPVPETVKLLVSLGAKKQQPLYFLLKEKGRNGVDDPIPPLPA